MDFDKSKVYGDTSITDGLVTTGSGDLPIFTCPTKIFICPVKMNNLGNMNNEHAQNMFDLVSQTENIQFLWLKIIAPGVGTISFCYQLLIAVSRPVGDQY